MELILAIVHSYWFECISKLTLGCLLAGIIGIERSTWSKPAGFRTHALLGVSSVLIMLCGEYMAREYNVDSSRLPAQLLSGIGFIGAGTILRDGFNVKGLTTATGLLGVTCIGLSIGAGFYLGGIITTLIIYIILSYSYKFSEKLDHSNSVSLQITITRNTDEVLSKIQEIFSTYKIDIKHIKKQDYDDYPGNVIKILGLYNKGFCNKNNLIKDIALIPHIVDLIED